MYICGMTVHSSCLCDCYIENTHCILRHLVDHLGVQALEEDLCLEILQEFNLFFRLDIVL